MRKKIDVVHSRLIEYIRVKVSRYFSDIHAILLPSLITVLITDPKKQQKTKWTIWTVNPK